MHMFSVAALLKAFQQMPGLYNRFRVPLGVTSLGAHVCEDSGGIRLLIGDRNDGLGQYSFYFNDEGVFSHASLRQGKTITPLT